MRRWVRDFSKARAGAVVLHARDGLLVPFGGETWFDLIVQITRECQRHHVPVWLYDEDPFPSGNAGGRILAEHPELAGWEICRFEAPPHLKTHELFVFPSGKLLWAGLLPPRHLPHAIPMERTGQVGMIRRTWEAAKNWTSRWYYPDTPLHTSPRAIANFAEMALQMPSVPSGWRLVSFVARPAGLFSRWGGCVDTLNPTATQKFIETVYDRYHLHLGRYFGKTIQAMFLDEPKWHASRPWTPGLFQDFHQCHGYDLRKRLNDLFESSHTRQEMDTRLRFRDWCTRRFETAWMQPVSRWCKKQGLALVGHISPEDDPIQQAACVGNLHPLQRHLTLPGIDLILPAVGDSRHSLLNVGPACAVGWSQQMNKPGVLSETLACSGPTPDPQNAAKILAWQTLMGVNTLVVHGAFNSSLGLRRMEAPPDFGPDSPAWAAMQDIQKALLPFWKITREATHLAPIAILWPIRSFMADGPLWKDRDVGMRRDLNDLLLGCLENQLGVHLLDESTLAEARLSGEMLRVGKADYRTILVPSCLILQDSTIRSLSRLLQRDFPVEGYGRKPSWEDKSGRLRPLTHIPWKTHALSSAYARLRIWFSRIYPFTLPKNKDLRMTSWRKNGKTTHLLMNLGSPIRNPAPFPFRLESDTLAAATHTPQGTWRLLHDFKTRHVSRRSQKDLTLSLKTWKVRWPRQSWIRIPLPLPAYQLHLSENNPRQVIAMTLTPSVAVGGKPVAPWMEYRAQVQIPQDIANILLVLEPTALRGHLQLIFKDHSWSRSIQDTDTRPIRINLSRLVTHGKPATFTFRFHQPQALDGITLSPHLLFKNHSRL